MIQALNLHQLHLQLDLPEPEPDEIVSTVSPEEAQLLSTRALQVLEERPEPPAWIAEWRELRDAGWPWRVAVYIAWCASPRDGRWPETQQELATQVLGLRSDRVLRTWRAKNPAIEAVIGYMQAKPLLDKRADIIRALAESASNPSHKNHPDRKLAAEMLGDYIPRKDFTLRPGAPAPDDLSQLTEAQLAEAERALKDE